VEILESGAGTMSTRWNNTLRHKQFDVAEKARKVASLETLIRDLDDMATALSQQIAFEEQRTRVKDPRSANYSMVALAAVTRRNKLIVSLADFRSQLQTAKDEHDKLAAVMRDLELARSGIADSLDTAQRVTT
jgi:hypothetical protein